MAPLLLRGPVLPQRETLRLFPDNGIRVRITAGLTKKQGLEVGHDL